MTDDTHRTWDIVFKWFGLVAVLASAWWTIHTYNEARTKDQNAVIFQRQAALYFDAAQAAATIATALDPDSDDTTVIDPKTLKTERERFEQLYWGELVI